MKIEYNLTEQDFINFNIDHYNKACSFKRTRLALQYLIPIFILVIGSGVIYFEDGEFWVGGCAILLAASIAWIFMFPKLMDHSIGKSTKRMIRDGKNNNFIGPQSLTLGEEYIEDEDALISSQVSYSSIEKIHSGHNLYYIYIGVIQAILVPHAAFHSDEEKDAFFQLIKEKSGVSFEK